MEIEPSRSVGQIAVEMRGAIPVFEKYRIDYYLKGDRSLRDACFAAEASWEKLAAELEGLGVPSEEWTVPEPDWRQETMASLIHFVVKTHHANTRLALDKIEKTFARLSRGEEEPSELSVIRTIFLKLAVQLREHLREEEQLVFPYLIGMERTHEKGEKPESPVPHRDGFPDSIRNLLFEHGMMDKEFKEIEKLIFHFRQGRGGFFAPLIESLEELRKDNQKHVHLENNILLKRASQLGLVD